MRKIELERFGFVSQKATNNFPYSTNIFNRKGNEQLNHEH